MQTHSTPFQSDRDDLFVQLMNIQGLDIEQLRDLQTRLAATEGPVEAKAYHDAHISYALLTLTRGKNPKAALALLNPILKRLEASKDPESMALLGACIGHKLQLSPMSVMLLHPKAKGLFQKAAKLSPENPRVLVMQGANVFYTPVVFGGGAKKALPFLEAAVKAAESERPSDDPWAPRWGHVEALAFLALAQADDNRVADAEASLAKAIGLNPEHCLLKYIGKCVETKIKESLPKTEV